MLRSDRTGSRPERMSLVIVFTSVAMVRAARLTGNAATPRACWSTEIHVRRKTQNDYHALPQAPRQALRPPHPAATDATPPASATKRSGCGRGRRAQRASCALQLLRGAPDGIPARQHAFLLLLWVELYYESGRVFVNGCGFSEIEDAVGAVQEFVDPAKRMQDGS
jgi:hypothetical protein